MALTQTQLIAALAERSELSKADAKRAPTALDEIVLEDLGNAQKVRIGGLVQLTVRVKASQKKRKGRNPATGEQIEIAAKPETAGDILALIEQLGGSATIVGNSMGAGAAALAAAKQRTLISGLVLLGPFVRNGKTSALQRLMLRVAMARPWAAISWRAYLPKLYAGRRPADFDEYRDRVVASLRRQGYAKAFSLTTRTSHGAAEAQLGDVTPPTVVVMGEKDHPESCFPREGGLASWARLRSRSMCG